MEKIVTPDYLVGLGGNGSRIVERFMKKDWIIDYLLRSEKEDDDPELHGRTVDSATGTEMREHDDAREKIVNKKIKKKRKTHGLRTAEGQYSLEYTDVDFEYYNYIDGTEQGIIGKSVLTKKTNVNKRIIDESDHLENCWWINDSDDLYADGFSNGVSRRRALSKALYHVSAVHEDSENTHPMNFKIDSEDSVVMVVALGGGTGSGSVIDIAQDMHEDASIDLFATIPDAGHADGNSDGSDELASAYAALSELEYLNLTDESPFRTVTLIPYHERPDISDEDFEDAVIHTILAHQFTINHDNGKNRLTPGQDNAIVPYHSFNIAVPRIVEYDAGMKSTAEDDVDEYLQQRNDQLELEQSLYKTVESFLTENFSDSFGAALEQNLSFDEDSPDQKKAVSDLAVRFEDHIQGSLLVDNRLDVAGVDVDSITEEIERIYDDLFDELRGGEGPVYQRVQANTNGFEYKSRIVDALSDQFPQFIRPDKEEYSGDLTEKLVEVIRMDAESISQRQNLLQAIYQTGADSVDGLDRDEVGHVKTALIDVVLDYSTRTLTSEFRNNELKQLRNEIKQELYEKEAEHAQLEQFETAVRKKVENSVTIWCKDKADEELERIANCVDNHDRIKELVSELNDACERKANKLSNDSFNESQIRNQLETADDVVEPTELDNLLGEVGIDDGIDVDGLEGDIRNLIRAKRAHEDYKGGGIFSSLFDSDEEHIDEFEDAKETVNYHDRFEITSDIEQPFNVAFRYEEKYKDLKEDVNKKFKSTVETVVEKLEKTLIEDGTPRRFAPSELVDEERVIERLKNEGSAPQPAEHVESDTRFSVPDDSSEIFSKFEQLERTLRGLLDQDREELENRTQTHIRQELGIDVVLAGDLDVDGTSTTEIERLVAAYLQPIRERKSEVGNRLERLGSSYVTDNDKDGLYHALDRLVRLSESADGYAPDNVNVAFSHPTTDINVTTGPELVEGYERENYTIPSTGERESRENNAFRRILRANNRDLEGSPSDIAEANIWGNVRNDSKIKDEFELSVEQMVEPKFSRLPVDLEGLHPSSDDVIDHLQELRIVNTYLSRAFEQTEVNSTPEFEPVADAVNKNLNQLKHDGDGYAAGRIGYGDEWTLSMVTFLSGFTLDMIKPVTEGDKYVKRYVEQHNTAEYGRKNHALGISGDWDGLPDDLVREITTTEFDREELGWYPHGGAYLYREPEDDGRYELVSPGTIGSWTRRVAEGEDVNTEDIKRRLRNRFAIKPFKSTVDIE